jgi:uncharacterized protein
MHPQNEPQKPALTSCCELVVLDTNVVLDWLLFADPHGLAWGGAVSSGRLSWIASAPMRDEFAHVLARGLAASRQADAPALLGAWDRLVTPAAPGAPSHLVCADPDDQKFLDLALAAGATWLVTRDRALLRLKARARALGLCIVKPDHPPADVYPAARPPC